MLPNLLQESSSIFWDSLEIVIPIDVSDAKRLAPPSAPAKKIRVSALVLPIHEVPPNSPLQVVQQAPTHVSGHRHPVFTNCIYELLDIPVKVCLSLNIIDTFGGSHLCFASDGESILGDVYLDSRWLCVLFVYVLKNFTESPRHCETDRKRELSAKRIMCNNVPTYRHTPARDSLHCQSSSHPCPEASPRCSRKRTQTCPAR